MAPYNAQICDKEKDYRLQFQTSDYAEFKEVEHAIQKIKDKYEARRKSNEPDPNQISLFDIVDWSQELTQC